MSRKRKCRRGCVPFRAGLPASYQRVAAIVLSLPERALRHRYEVEIEGYGASWGRSAAVRALLKCGPVAGVLERYGSRNRGLRRVSGPLSGFQGYCERGKLTAHCVRSGCGDA